MGEWSEIIEKLEDQCRNLNVRCAFRAHAGCGTVHCHAVGDESALERLMNTWNEVPPEEGHAYMDRIPAGVKGRVPIWGNPAYSGWEWMARVREALDPGRILNPGRLPTEVA